jgi:hypothetical protein
MTRGGRGHYTRRNGRILPANTIDVKSSIAITQDPLWQAAYSASLRSKARTAASHQDGTG